MNVQAGDLPAAVISSLSAHIGKCLSEAQSHKQDIVERLLACERQRAGEYDADTKRAIAAIGGQEVFVMLTDIKCRAADAWIKDVMMNHGEASWTLSPTSEPTLPPELTGQITQVVAQEAAMVAASGIPVDPSTMIEREHEIAREADAKVKEEATLRSKKMERRILDKLQEGGWRDTLAALIYDFCTYPAVFMKGPVLRKRKRMAWGPNFQPVVQEETVIEVDRISPWDIFPSPAAVSIQDGYLIHRHRLSRKAVRQMIDMPGASKEAIESVLEQYRLGLKTTLTGESEHEYLMGRRRSWDADGLLETFEYWGPASGQMLIEWGLEKVDGQKIDPLDEYQINAWKIGGYVIRAQINPDPLDRRPYSKACFEDVPGSFWGRALPEMMSDVQTMVNAAARAQAANMGIASGPQCEVHIDRLAPGERITSQYPWRVWQTHSDRTGNGQPAVRYFQPSMNSGELLQIQQAWSKTADEVTGVPNYVYGSSSVSGAGRTSSGLAMLMENAAKGIKHAILNLDAATTEVISRIYEHLMIYDQDQSIKGDLKVVAAGAIGAMLREQQQIARREFMAAVLNPVDAQIIGAEGRAFMLREAAQGIFTDIDKIVPAPEKLRAMLEQQQQMAQQAAMQQQAAQPQSADALS